MTSKRLFNNSIHQRFLVVALLPLLLITSLLSFYTINARWSDLSQSLNQSGELTSDYLATISDFALYSKNTQLLSATTQSAMRLPDVAGIAYLDKDDELLLGTGIIPTPIPSTASGIKDFTSQDGYLYFKKPVYLSGIEFNDYQQENPNSTANTELIGWVIVIIDHSSLLEKQHEVIVTSLWLILAGFIIAIPLTYFLSLKLIAPIRQLTTTIKKMAQGHLDLRAETGTRDELAILASGINQLAESVAEGKVNLEDKIRVATYKLEVTLADLQKKNLELETARHEAETANLSKSDFLARMSHELRTPITSIQGFIRLLEATRLPETDRHYCHIIDQAAQQLLVQIDDILAFSKLQSNTVELTQHPIDLAECTEQVVVLFSLQAQHKGLDLIVDYAPDLPLRRIGDSVRIQQIISNLIANAIKFCDEGGVYIHLKGDKQSNLIIEVMDTGIGIQEKAQDQLFTAFAQADTSISRLYGGTGLGLSILKNLVDLMGGQVTLDSTVGKGSTFKIVLPLPLTKTQPDWHIEHKKVVLSVCHEPITNALIHALERFHISDITVTDLAELFSVAAKLSRHDRVILCPPTSPPQQFNVSEFLLKLRAVTPAKLILMAAQFNYYQQFNAKQRADLHPITFLAMPPPLSELQRALKQSTANKTVPTIAPPNIHLLDGVNILIAEDNQFTRLLLDTLLSKLGAYCTLTSNGNEAIAACQHDKFDLFLVDIHMPMKNGIETINTLRKSSNLNANLPILAVTADILQQEEMALFEAGANGLLLKPLDEEELLNSICQQLNLKPPEDPIPTATTSGDLSSEVFRKEVHSLLEGAKSVLKSDNIPQLREIIHQLRGIAGVFKLTQLEEQVKQLHQLVKTNCLEQVPVLLDQISSELNNTNI
jgi:two-component system, NarL family, sensor histidine kinase BarA